MTKPTTEADDRVHAELAGRMYEALDIQMAIDDGHFRSVRALSRHLGGVAEQLNSALKCSHLVPSPDQLCCVDLQTTIEASHD